MEILESQSKMYDLRNILMVLKPAETAKENRVGGNENRSTEMTTFKKSKK